MAITKTKGSLNVILKRNEPVLNKDTYDANTGVLTREEITSLSFDTFKTLSATNDLDIYTAVTGITGISYPLDDRDSKYIFILKNGASADKDIYVKSGRHPYFLGLVDLKITVKANSQIAIALDSAKFSQYEGERAGQVVFVGADTNVTIATIKVAY